MEGLGGEARTVKTVPHSFVLRLPLKDSPEDELTVELTVELTAEVTVELMAEVILDC